MARSRAGIGRQEESDTAFDIPGSKTLPYGLIEGAHRGDGRSFERLWVATLRDIDTGDGPHVRRIGHAGTVPSVGSASPPFRAGELAAIDLRRLFAAFRRRLPLFAAVALSITALVVVATLLATPKYTAAAEVMLDPRSQTVTKVEDVLSALPAESTVVDTEIEVLKSRQLAERVVEALHLDRDPEFNRRLRGDVGLRGQLVNMGLLRTTKGQADAADSRAREQIVNAVTRNLSVNRAGLTYVIRIGFESENPAKAAKIANAFADLYIARQVEAKFQATRQAANWLNSRLNDLRAQVLADETAVQQFKIANNLLSASGTTLTEQEISSYNQSLAQARAQVAEDQARLNTARMQLAKGSSGDDVGETLSSPAITKYKEQRAEVSKRVASLQTQFRDQYPELRRARNELADLDAQIQAETHRIISNLDAKAQVSRQRAAAVGASLGGAQGQLAANNRASVRLNELERNAQASRTLYETYLARYKETSTQEGLQKADARVLSMARLPTAQSSPNLALNLLVGSILAIAAGMGAVVLAEKLDAGLTTSADVERRFRIRYLGAVPLLSSVAGRTSLSPIDYVVAKPFSGFAEAFRSLRASIIYSSLGPPVKVVVVTSALPGEGKTTTAICLGRAAALQGAKVVIVDCDLRRRSVQRQVRTRGASPMHEALAAKCDLVQVLMKDAETDADILTLKDDAASPKDVFGTPAIDVLLAQLRGLYDMIILDATPILPVADSRILARKADFVLFVARWRATPFHAVEGALRLLHGSSVEVSGIVLSQVDMGQQARYGYGDPGYYFKAYQAYYLEPPSEGAADQERAGVS